MCVCVCMIECIIDECFVVCFVFVGVVIVCSSIHSFVLFINRPAVK